MVLFSYFQVSLMIIEVFYESWNESKFNSLIKNEIQFTKIVIHFPKEMFRGLHYQVYPFEQEKLVSCIYGEIYDVIVDLRPKSISFKTWISVKLDAEKNNYLFPKLCTVF